MGDNNNDSWYVLCDCPFCNGNTYATRIPLDQLPSCNLGNNIKYRHVPFNYLTVQEHFNPRFKQQYRPYSCQLREYQNCHCGGVPLEVGYCRHGYTSWKSKPIFKCENKQLRSEEEKKRSKRTKCPPFCFRQRKKHNVELKPDERKQNKGLKVNENNRVASIQSDTSCMCENIPTDDMEQQIESHRPPVCSSLSIEYLVRQILSEEMLKAIPRCALTVKQYLSQALNEELQNTIPDYIKPMKSNVKNEVSNKADTTVKSIQTSCTSIKEKASNERNSEETKNVHEDHALYLNKFKKRHFWQFIDPEGSDLPIGIAKFHDDASLTNNIMETWIRVKPDDCSSQFKKEVHIANVENKKVTFPSSSVISRHIESDQLKLHYIKDKDKMEIPRVENDFFKINEFIKTTPVTEHNSKLKENQEKEIKIDTCATSTTGTSTNGKCNSVKSLPRITKTEDILQFDKILKDSFAQTDNTIPIPFKKNIGSDMPTQDNKKSESSHRNCNQSSCIYKSPGTSKLHSTTSQLKVHSTVVSCTDKSNLAANDEDTLDYVCSSCPYKVGNKVSSKRNDTFSVLPLNSSESASSQMSRSEGLLTVPLCNDTLINDNQHLVPQVENYISKQHDHNEIFPNQKDFSSISQQSEMHCKCKEQPFKYVKTLQPNLNFCGRKTDLRMTTAEEKFDECMMPKFSNNTTHILQTLPVIGHWSENVTDFSSNTKCNDRMYNQEEENYDTMVDEPYCCKKYEDSTLGKMNNLPKSSASCDIKTKCFHSIVEQESSQISSFVHHTLNPEKHGSFDNSKTKYLCTSTIPQERYKQKDYNNQKEFLHVSQVNSHSSSKSVDFTSHINKFSMPKTKLDGHTKAKCNKFDILKRSQNSIQSAEQYHLNKPDDSEGAYISSPCFQKLETSKSYLTSDIKYPQSHLKTENFDSSYCKKKIVSDSSTSGENYCRIIHSNKCNRFGVNEQLCAPIQEMKLIQNLNVGQLNKPEKVSVLQKYIIQDNVDNAKITKDCEVEKGKQNNECSEIKYISENEFLPPEFFSPHFNVLSKKWHSLSRHPQTMFAVEKKSSSECQIPCSESKATYGHSFMQMIPTSLCNTVTDLMHNDNKNVNKENVTYYCNMSDVCNDNKRTDDYQHQMIGTSCNFQFHDPGECHMLKYSNHILQTNNIEQSIEDKYLEYKDNDFLNKTQSLCNLSKVDAVFSSDIDTAASGFMISFTKESKGEISSKEGAPRLLCITSGLPNTCQDSIFKDKTFPESWLLGYQNAKPFYFQNKNVLLRNPVTVSHLSKTETSVFQSMQIKFTKHYFEHESQLQGVIKALTMASHPENVSLSSDIQNIPVKSVLQDVTSVTPSHSFLLTRETEYHSPLPKGKCLTRQFAIEDENLLQLDKQFKFGKKTEFSNCIMCKNTTPAKGVEKSSKLHILNSLISKIGESSSYTLQNEQRDGFSNDSISTCEHKLNTTGEDTTNKMGMSEKNSFCIASFPKLPFDIIHSIPNNKITDSTSSPLSSCIQTKDFHECTVMTNCYNASNSKQSLNWSWKAPLISKHVANHNLGITLNVANLISTLTKSLHTSEDVIRMSDFIFNCKLSETSSFLESLPTFSHTKIEVPYSNSTIYKDSEVNCKSNHKMIHFPTVCQERFTHISANSSPKESSLECTAAKRISAYNNSFEDSSSLHTKPSPMIIEVVRTLPSHNNSEISSAHQALKENLHLSTSYINNTINKAVKATCSYFMTVPINKMRYRPSTVATQTENEYFGSNIPRHQLSVTFQNKFESVEIQTGPELFNIWLFGAWSNLISIPKGISKENKITSVPLQENDLESSQDFGPVQISRYPNGDILEMVSDSVLKFIMLPLQENFLVQAYNSHDYDYFRNYQSWSDSYHAIVPQEIHEFIPESKRISEQNLVSSLSRCCIYCVERAKVSSKSSAVNSKLNYNSHDCCSESTTGQAFIYEYTSLSKTALDVRNDKTTISFSMGFVPSQISKGNTRHKSIKSCDYVQKLNTNVTQDDEIPGPSKLSSVYHTLRNVFHGNTKVKKNTKRNVTKKITPGFKKNKRKRELKFKHKNQSKIEVIPKESLQCTTYCLPRFIKQKKNS